MKSLLLFLVLRLPAFPFSRLLGLYYAAAVRAATRAARRVEGVVAVYLSGSFAGGKPIYGLSDIDFKVFVSGPRRGDRLRRLRDAFSRLRRVFPMLGPADEKGIYFTSDFPADYERYPLVRHLFDGRFYGHRLLWGRDVIRDFGLVPPSGEDLDLTFIWKLRSWMERICLLGSRPGLAGPQRRYLFFKWVADAGALLLMKKALHGEGDRESAIRRLKALLPRDSAPALDRLLEERRGLFRRSRVDPETCFALVKRIIHEVLEEMSRGEEERAPSNRPVERAGPAGEDGERLDDETAERIRRLCGCSVFFHAMSSAALPVSPLDSGSFGRPLCVIVPERPLSLSSWLKLSAARRAGLLGQRDFHIWEDRHFLYAVFEEFMEPWLSTRLTEGHLFAGLERTDVPVPGSFFECHLRRKLEAFVAQVREIAAGRGFLMMEPEARIRFVLFSLRTAVLFQALEAGEWDLPADAAATASRLKKRAEAPSSLIDGLLAAHKAFSRGEDYPFEPLLEGARRLLLETCRGASRKTGDAGGAGREDAGDRRGLRISVVLITRDRCRQLDRCLGSLARLKRRPDEVVVVDNASTDETARVVRDFRAEFPVRYVLEPRLGIATARNAGVRASSGEVLAFTDDDAVVDPEWLGFVERAFLRDPRIGIVGGAILNLKTERRDVVARYFEAFEESRP
jgi:predicted nucleotidyltransferase